MSIKSILAKKTGLTSGLRYGLQSLHWGNDATSYPPRDIEYGNGLFVAINKYGHVAISSNNGATWTTNGNLSKLGFGGTIALKWANNHFYALNNMGVIAISSDGINWSINYNLTDTVWQSAYAINNSASKISLDWNGSVLIATRVSNTSSFDGSSVLATSPDGITWTSSTSFSALNITPDVVVINGTDIIVVSAGTIGKGTVATSRNSGITWTTNTSLSGKFTAANVVCGDNSNGTIVVAYYQTYAVSNDAGASWTISTVTNGPSGGPYFIKKIGTKFLAGGGGGVIIESTDGITWSKLATLSSTTWSTNYVLGMAWNGTAAVIYNGARCITATSTDGITWTYNGTIPSTVGTAEWLPVASARIAYGNGIYVAIGYGAAVPCLAISTNLDTWIDKSATIAALGWPITSGITNVYFKNNIFIIIGAGYIATSADGITWSSYNANLRTAGYTTIPNSLCYANGKYVVIAPGYNYLYYSTNLVTWTKVTLSGSARTAASSDSKFVIIGNSGVVYTSTDAITWSSGTQLATTIWSTNYAPSSMTWTGSKFIAVSTSGILIASSADGITWTTAQNTYMNGASYIYADPANPGFIVITNNTAGSAIYVLFSTDNGVTWFSPLNLSSFNKHYTMSIPFFSACIVNKKVILGGGTSLLYVC